jgi:hypothetical protein
MKNKLLKIYLLGFILITLLNSCTKPKIELKLNLEQGKTYLMGYQTDMKMNQKIMGMSIDVKMKIDMDLLFKTIGYDKDSNYLMETTYKSMNYKMNAQGQDIEFGTETIAKDSTMNKVFNAFKGKSFTITFNKYGKIIDVHGIDSIMTTFFNDNYYTDSTKINEIKELFGKNFGEESIINNFSSFFGYFPEKEVSIGEKWKNNTTIKTMFALNIDNEYQLIDNKNDLYNIGIQSNIKTDSKNSTMDVQGMQMKFEMKGTQTGYIKLDQKTGWIKESEIKQKIVGDARMSKSEIPGGGNFSIPYTVESTTKIFLK